MRRVIQRQVTTIQIVSIEFIWAEESTCTESAPNEMTLTLPTVPKGLIVSGNSQLNDKSNRRAGKSPTEIGE
jgi:hypothetical protein